ncbi:MAG: DUF4465 domain-containing protein [Bacteroidales bacterium]|jgi:hypothetical protein|nr:DUF4465 domain-containing protein [Bacteroidales bacterium]
MKKTILSIAFTLLSIGVFAQFDGSVGTNGCKAISINSPSIKAWALGVQVNRGKQTDDTSLYASYGSNDWAIGKPDSTTTRAVSLGEGGSCIITFDRPIFNGAGYDFMITENSFGVMTNSQSNSEFLELTFVEVSSDGINYFRFPAISNNTTTDCKSSLINNLAGKYSVGWGCGFNLDDIPNNVLLDKNNIRFIRLVDVRNGQDTDSRGNIIYEAPGSFGYSSGFDLTGVGIINGKTPYIVSSMDSLLTNNNSYEIVSTSNSVMGADSMYRKDFVSNGLAFQGLGYYSYGYFMSIGFASSNMTAVDSSNTLSSSYVSASKGGLNGSGDGYINAYYSDYGDIEHCVIKRDDSSMFYPQGVYVNTSLSMYNHFTSSSFPANGWETLTAIGYDENGNKTDSTTIYLADTNGNKINSWTYMDLSNLSLCKKIIMKLNGNDKSYGYLNVPSYFCLDNFSYSTSNATTTTPTLSLPRTISVAIDSIDSDAIVHYSTLAGDSTTVVSSNYQFLDYATKTITSSILANTLYIARVIAIDSKGDTFYSPEVLFEKVDVSGLDNLDISSMISLYPNPTNATSNLVLSLNDNAQVNIFDIQGRCLQTMRLDKSSTTPINLQGRKGVFYIRIISANQTTTKKLIIQ